MAERDELALRLAEAEGLAAAIGAEFSPPDSDGEGADPPQGISPASTAEYFSARGRLSPMWASPDRQQLSRPQPGQELADDSSSPDASSSPRCRCFRSLQMWADNMRVGSCVLPLSRLCVACHELSYTINILELT